MPDDEPEPEGHERLVSTAYDRVGDAYLQQFGVSPAKDAWRVELARRTVPRGHILDLGCGAGVPVARDLIDAGFQVTGIDGSPRQIALACENVPGGVFIVGDMAAADFPAGHFDGVAAFFSILHVPRRDHAELMRKIARWLRPGAAFVGSFTIHDSPGWVGDWLGAPMFFNGFDDATNRQIVADAGLAIELAEVCAEDNDAPFLWLAARKTEGWSNSHGVQRRLSAETRCQSKALHQGAPSVSFAESSPDGEQLDLPPKKWTGLSRSAFHLFWAEIAQG